MRRNNPFREIKRIVGQFFETEYWYRFRKRQGDDDRAVSTLNDTWNGEWTLLNWQIRKVEHMYHNLRKYGAEAQCYIDSSSFLESYTEADELLAIEYVKNYAIDEGRCIWYGGKYYYCFDAESNKWTIFDRKVVDVIPADKLPKNQRFYHLEFDDDGNILDHKPCDKEAYEYDMVANFTSWADMAEWVEMNDPDVKDFNYNAILYAQSIHIETTDLHRYSKVIRDKVRGQRRKLHDLAKYRRLLIKLKNMDFTYDEPWSSKSDEICKLYKDDDKKKSEEYDKLWKDFKATRRKLLDEIADLWNERADFWWD